MNALFGPFIGRVLVLARSVGPYAAIELLLPGGSVVALLYWWYRHRVRAHAIEADKFRNYASAWRDRWNSVMELFMAGGNYAASEVPFPHGFPDAVQAEVAVAR
jgi:hypothetical protein